MVTIQMFRKDINLAHTKHTHTKQRQRQPRRTDPVQFIWPQIFPGAFVAIRAAHDHALRQKIDKRLTSGNQSDVVKKMIDEACIVQVHDCCRQPHNVHRCTQVWCGTGVHYTGVMWHRCTQVWCGTGVHRCNMAQVKWQW